MKTKNLSVIGMFLSIIILGSQINISLGLIPFTLQILSISIVSQILPPRQAILTLALYNAIGLLGFPVFAKSSGGLQILLSPTLGFLIGFFPYSYLVSKAKYIEKKAFKLLISGLAYVSLYAFGLGYLLIYLRLSGTNNFTFFSLVMTYWLPFLLTDTLSLVLSYFVYIRIKSIVK